MSPFIGGPASHCCRQQIKQLLPSRRLYHCNRVIQEHDVLFLRQHGVKHAKWHLTTPLRPGGRVKLAYGASLPSSELIGRRLLDTVQDSGGNSVILHEPTLSSYIVNSERLATPIYPHDANAIVSLLDLNPSRPGEDDDHHDDNGLQHNQPTPPFEIFEAGTGMGSLTLHIARAMHAANPPIPSPLRRMLCEARFKPQDDTEETATNTKPPRRLDLSPEDQSIFDDYSASRRAILHTLDRNDKHARAAYKLVRNFRRAHYLPSVDFHVGSVDEYLSSRLEKSGGRPFLSRAILDLPSAHENAEHVVQALHSNGLLILFNPSISQIADFQSWSTETDQPLRLEKVIELHVTSATEGAVHDGGGGRNWDVKTVVPKAHQDGSGAGKPVQVMRPKVGERIAGGGFVAVLRRWPVASVSNQDSIPPEIPDETVSQ